MRKLHRTATALTLAMISGLIVLSVVGAFLGAERAGRMFNSPPMAPFWALLAVALAAACLFSRPVRRRPGVLAAHLGCVLIIMGGAAGSRLGHRLAHAWFGDNRIRHGWMELEVGRANDTVVLHDRKDLATLPFTLVADDAWIEYDEPASLAILHPTDDEGVTLVPPQSRQPHAVGDFTIRIVDHLGRARGEYPADARGALVLIGPDGRPTFAPETPGETVELADSTISARILDVMSNPTPVRRNDEWVVVDQPGPRTNPALRVRIQPSDAEAFEWLLFARPAPQPPLPEGVRMRYLFPDPPIAAPDPDSHHAAMQVEVSRGERTRRFWLLEDPTWDRDTLSLAAAPGFAPDGDDGAPQLRLVRPEATVTAHKATLTVLERGRPVAGGTIGPNAPLHHRGYHIYLPGLDPADPTAFVLDIRSDRGLTLIYVGFALLGGGTAWSLWRPRR